MKSFNLATNKFFRKAIGFLLIAVGVYFSIDKINTNLEVLMFLFAVTFAAYVVLEYSSYGNDQWVTLDFRTQDEIEHDEVNRKSKLIEAAKENLILEVASGTLSRARAEERLDALLFLQKEMDSNKLLAAPLEQDYV